MDIDWGCLTKKYINLQINVVLTSRGSVCPLLGAELHPYHAILQLSTLPETNIAPENRPLESRRFLLETIIFRGELLVSGRVAFLNNFGDPPSALLPHASVENCDM